MNAYYLGQSVFIDNLQDSGTEAGEGFTNQSGTEFDPTTVTLRVGKPDGTETLYTYSMGEITKDATGRYSKVITADAVGVWIYLWTGTTSGVTAVFQGQFRVVNTIAS